jgi:hypothetical protein
LNEVAFGNVIVSLAGLLLFKLICVFVIDAKKPYALFSIPYATDVIPYAIDVLSDLEINLDE